MATELKDQIASLVGSAPADTWVVKQVIRKIVQHTGQVTSDDVRFYVKEFKPSSMVVGSAFRQLVQDGFLEKKGTKKTDIRSSKGRDIAVYVQAQ
jgi:hypothetical protein